MDVIGSSRKDHFYWKLLPQVKVTDTDQIAILLESPPASGKFAPRADLDAAEAPWWLWR